MWPGLFKIAICFAVFVGPEGVRAALQRNGGLVDENSVSALVALDKAMEAVTSKVTPSIVNIEVTARTGGDEQPQNGRNNPMQNLPPSFGRVFGPDFQMQPPPQSEHSIGSGVIISPDGYIITNDHVVAGATKIRVTLSDRRVLAGRVVGTDRLTDIAVLKVDAGNLRSIAWGDSTKLEVGQTVLAFGSPFGALRFSVTRGIVSALGRQNPFRDDARKPESFIQTDAAINPGNSGGALVNAYGELIGINQSILSNSGSFQGAGFAIPSQIAHSVADQLIAHGKVDHGYIGISMNDVTPDNARFFKLKDPSGAIVAQVMSESPAAHGGMQQGDVIVAYNGHSIVTGSDLQVAVSEMRPGTPLKLDVIRNGLPVKRDLTVGEFDRSRESTPVDQGHEDSAQPGHTSKLGLTVGNLDDQTRKQLTAPADLLGVVVESVRTDSPADDAGLQPGDIILQVNRNPALDADQFTNAVHEAPQNQDLLFLVWSKGATSYRTVRPTTGLDEQYGERKK